MATLYRLLSILLAEVRTHELGRIQSKPLGWEWKISKTFKSALSFTWAQSHQDVLHCLKPRSTLLQSAAYMHVGITTKCLMIFSKYLQCNWSLLVAVDTQCNLNELLSEFLGSQLTQSIHCQIIHTSDHSTARTLAPKHQNVFTYLPTSVTRFGYLRKSLLQILLQKQSKYFGTFWAFLKNPHL